MSAFAPADGVVRHIYSTDARGVERLMGTYGYLDVAPLGRNEEGLEPPATWWRRHDESSTRAGCAMTKRRIRRREEWRGR